MTLIDDIDSSEYDTEYSSDSRITVYIVSPHPYDSDYDDFITDNLEIATKAAHDAVEKIFDDDFQDCVYEERITVNKTRMSKGEYEMLTEDSD